MTKISTPPCIGTLFARSLAITTLLGASAFAAPQASLTLKGGNAALSNHNNTAWDLTKTTDGATGELGKQTVIWTITATKGETSANTLQVNGFVAVQNTGTANATIGNIVVNLQRQKNIGTATKPKWTWASVSADVATAALGDDATSANIVTGASQEVPAYSGGGYTISGAKGTFVQNSASDSLSFVDSDSNTIWAINPQQVIAPAGTVNLLFTANFNNTVLKIPAGESVRAEVIVTFGGVGPRGGSGASAANIDVNGNGKIEADEAGVRSVPTRLTQTVPALKAYNSEVTLIDPGVTTCGTVTVVGGVVSDGAPTAPISDTTQFTVTATDVDGGAEGGTISNTATLTGESGSVSVITGYKNEITGQQTITNVDGTTTVVDIYGPVPVCHDFECCEGVDLEKSATADIAPNKEIVTDPPEAPKGFQPGDFASFSMGGLGGKGDPFKLLEANFATLYPNGVEVGIPGVGGFSMKFSAAAKVQDFLPHGGKSEKALTVDLTNPAECGAGNFAGQLLALKLNIALSDGGATPAGLGNLIYRDPNNTGDSLNGQSARQILAVAEIAIGGGALPAGYDYTALAKLCDNLNLSWDTVKDGVYQYTAWAASCLSKP